MLQRNWEIPPKAAFPSHREFRLLRKSGEKHQTIIVALISLISHFTNFTQCQRYWLLSHSLTLIQWKCDSIRLNLLLLCFWITFQVLIHDTNWLDAHTNTHTPHTNNISRTGTMYSLLVLSVPIGHLYSKVPLSSTLLSVYTLFSLLCIQLIITFNWKIESDVYV